MKTATLNGRKSRYGRPEIPVLNRVSSVHMYTNFAIPDAIKIRRLAKSQGLTVSAFLRRAVLAALEDT